jgi:hypothetical protein
MFIPNPFGAGSTFFSARALCSPGGSRSVKWLNLAISESHYCIPNAAAVANSAQNTQIPRSQKLLARAFLATTILDKGNRAARQKVYYIYLNHVCEFLKPVC